MSLISRSRRLSSARLAAGDLGARSTGGLVGFAARFALRAVFGRAVLRLVDLALRAFGLAFLLMGPGTAGVSPALSWCGKARAGGTPAAPGSSVQGKHEQVARCFQIVVLHRMQVAAAALHRQVLLGPDRIDDRRALEGSAD